MTYHVGKGKNHTSYNDQDIKKKYRVNENQRKNLLIKIIELNPNILHTHVLEMALEFGMSKSKRPYEDLLNELEKEKTLTSIKKGKSPNSPRLWSLVTPDLVKIIEFNNMMEIKYNNRIKDLNEIMPHVMKLPSYQKAQFLVIRLDEISDRLTNTKLVNNYVDMSKVISKLENEEKLIHKIFHDDKICFVFALQILNNMYKNKVNTTIKMINEIPL